MNGNRITGVHTRSNKNGEKSTYYGRVTINACGISRLRVRAGERGGGLSGLTAAIESAKSGRKTAIVTTGQSALHFWSGSFEFLCSIVLSTAVFATDDVNPDTRDNFRVTGLSHLLCVSGFHVGVVAALVMLILSPMRLTGRRMTLDRKSVV